MENTTNLLNLNETQLLALCKRVMKLELNLNGATALRCDGIDIDAWILMRARSWYARLLLDGPVEWLPVEDVTSDVALTATNQGVVKAFPPARCVRPVEWQLQGWSRGVTCFVTPSDAVALLQDNLWTRAGGCQPVIVDHGNWLTMYSIPAGMSPVLLQARCVVNPAPGRYIFHEAALPLLEVALGQ